VRYLGLPHKNNNKILAPSEIVATAWIAPKIYQGEPQTFGSQRSVSDPVFQSLVVSLVMPRPDYGNATLAGLPVSQLRRLQSILNAATRLIHPSPRYPFKYALSHSRITCIVFVYYLSNTHIIL